MVATARMLRQRSGALLVELRTPSRSRGRELALKMSNGSAAFGYISGFLRLVLRDDALGARRWVSDRRGKGSTPFERDKRMETHRLEHYQKKKVSRLAFAIAADPKGEASGVFDPGGGYRKVGDRWSEAVGDLGMTVTIDTRNGALQVILTLRVDSYKDRDWTSAEAMPTVIAVVPWAPVIGFAIEIDGLHACGLYPIGADPADATTVRERLFGNAVKTLAIVGLSRDRIHLLKRGVHLERIFEVFAATCAATPFAIQEDDYTEAFDVLVDPPDVLFAEAMATYLGLPVA